MSKKQAIQVTRIPTVSGYLDLYEDGPNVVFSDGLNELITLDIEEVQLLADAINAAVERMKTK
jgi:hypothetical protein